MAHLRRRDETRIRRRDAAISRSCRATAGLAAGLLAGAWLALPGTALAADDDAAVEELVRAVYFEGIAPEDAWPLSDAETARLIAMLGDEGESTAHANIVSVLGMGGAAGSYEALNAYAARTRGAVDRAGFRALRGLPLAMSHLASRDARAMQWLAAAARSSAADPGWSFGRHAGPALATQLRQAAIQALGECDRAEASAVLEELASDPAAASVAADARAAITARAERVGSRR